MAIPKLILFSLVFFTFSISSADPDPAYQSLLQCLTETIGSPNVSSIVIPPTNPDYAPVLAARIHNARFNRSSTPKPAIIITPLEPSHVSAAVICSQKVGFQLKTRSGGHDYEGFSYVSDKPFFMLDMFNLRNISIDMVDESAWVQAGATLGELYYNIWEKSNVHGFPAGVCPTVGAGGHIGGGGYGTLIRKYGVSTDHVVDVNIVDVNGKILDRKGMGEDYFWAIRGGGGGSFGVILAYKIKLVRVPEKVTVFRVERSLAENATNIAFKWQTVAATTDSNLFMRMLLQPDTCKKKTSVRVKIMGLFLGDANGVVALLDKEFPELGLKKQNCTEMRWIDSVLWWANFDLGTSPKVLLDRTNRDTKFVKRKSDYVQTPIPIDGLESLWKKMAENEKVGLTCNSYGGKMNEIKATETAFAHRAGNLYKIQYSVNWEDPGIEADATYLNQARAVHDLMTQFVSKNPRRAYMNYRDIDIGTAKTWRYEEGKAYGMSYFDGNYERLVDVKTKVDPKNIFRNEQSVPPRSINTK
ncbi:oligogalacturonide oxidase 3 [Hibiscus trionum]|uniref:Oligogalacturonide oxidase 3 n=1 Tax=Hibiscus trionum TaxID=183268 RepID=A0A9W7IA17_HIBTR|nr:oligogalacturonide oxidase 3 [Hibiscus trionum]